MGEIAEVVEQVDPGEVQETTGEETTQVAAETPEPAPEPTAKEKALQAELSRVRQKNRELEASFHKPEPDPVAQAGFVPPGLSPKPQLDQFEDYDQYVEALGAWGAEKTILTREYTAQQTQKQTAQQAVFKTHAERMEAAKEKYADLDDVMALAPDCQFNQDAFAAILESEQSADIVYHLSKNAKEAERIAALPPVKQIMEIARLEDKFKATPAQPVKRVSQAPAPINTLGGAGADVLAGKEPDAATDPDGWLKWEKARVAKLGRRY